MKTTPKYAIRKTHSFYNSKSTRSLVTSRDNCDPLTFDTLADAKAYITELDHDTYCTAHNEISRPEYKAINLSRLPDYLIAQL